jgi:hypothetical protein
MPTSEPSITVMVETFGMGNIMLRSPSDGTFSRNFLSACPTTHA